MSNKDSFLSGLTMGLCGKGVPGITASDTFTRGYLLGAELRSKRKPVPVAYSYNGTVLPELPEWDRETYPYATIKSKVFEDGSFGVALVISNKELNVSSKGLGSDSLSNDGVLARYELADDADSWNQTNNSHSSYPVIWANYDVYYMDTVEDVGGTLYLSATAPIPVSGIVAYSYNGTVLPDINAVWDKEAYPYAFMKQHTNNVSVYLLSNPVTCSTSEDKVLIPPNTKDARYGIENGGIRFFATHEIGDGGSYVLHTDNLCWANHDVINVDDNTVYLAASEPVPVYE